MQPLTDKNGFPYFDRLPDEYRLATMDDFHVNGRLNIGLEFLIKWHHSEYYEVRTVKPCLKGAYIKPFIDEGRVFVKSNK